MEDTPDTRATTVSTLRKAGLTESQASGYLALIENGQLTPVQLAEKTGESRTNGYMICEKLETLGLATKKEGKKALYTPTHPSSLEILAEKRRKVVTRNEQEVKNGLSPLIDLFYLHNEAPSTRTLQGLSGIKEVYEDTLRVNRDIYLVRSRSDEPTLGSEFFNNYRRERAAKGINTYSLTPLSPEGREHVREQKDQELLYHRTFIPLEAYTAPVEIDIYGDKVALISFGETQMATIIDSPTIAESMRQLCKLLIGAYREKSDTEIRTILSK